jgi:hypothetical protein
MNLLIHEIFLYQTSRLFIKVNFLPEVAVIFDRPFFEPNISFEKKHLAQKGGGESKQSSCHLKEGPQPRATSSHFSNACLEIIDVFLLVSHRYLKPICDFLLGNALICVR